MFQHYTKTMWSVVVSQVEMSIILFYCRGDNKMNNVLSITKTFGTKGGELHIPALNAATFWCH